LRNMKGYLRSYQIDIKIAIPSIEYPASDLSFESKYQYYLAMAHILSNHSHVKTALDIGCNTGALVKAFKNFGIEAYGVDVSQIAVSHVPQELKDQITLLDVTQDRLPFENEKFDLITMLDVAEHLSSFEWALCEINRTLKVGGRFYISTPSKVTEMLIKVSAQRTDPNHINVHSKRSWIHLLEKYGMEYINDFPKAERQEAIILLSKSRFERLMLRIYGMPFIPDLRSDLIFEKVCSCKVTQ
jgi:SAM-dependent methyltransferase